MIRRCGNLWLRRERESSQLALGAVTADWGTELKTDWETDLEAEQQETGLQTGGQETELQVTELRMGTVLQPETINREHEMETDLLIY